MPDSTGSVAVRLENVEKTYRTGEVDVHAVRGVSLEIARGEFVALMGASGSGKSTLMNILGCLDRSTTGRYFLDGEDVSSLSRDQLADVRNRKLGFVFQSFNEKGITVIMVTHEADIAAYARRNVIMRDGRILSDRSVTRRTIAALELTKLGGEPEDPLIMREAEVSLGK